VRRLETIQTPSSAVPRRVLRFFTFTQCFEGPVQRCQSDVHLVSRQIKNSSFFEIALNGPESR
jgi:hypothetical protein